MKVRAQIILEYLDCQEHDEGININSFHIGFSPEKNRISKASLVRENKPVLNESYEFEYRKNFRRKALFCFPDYQEIDASLNEVDFLKKSSSTIRIISMTFSCERSNLK